MRNHSVIKLLTAKKIIVLVSSILLIALFLYAAYNKLIIYSVFKEQLKASPITNGFQNYLAWFIPTIEIIIPILFFIKKTRTIAFYSSFFLMVLFTVYVYVLPHFFADSVPCSCGGIISKFDWKEHFYFNLLFTLIAAIGLITHTSVKEPYSPQLIAKNS